MRLPAIWLVVAFVAGIAFAQAHKFALATCAIATAAALCVAAVLLWRKKAGAAWVVALVAWGALGAAAVAVEQASVPSNSVASLIAAGRLDTSEPLRWRGRLRTDPEDRPWGKLYEIDLEQVQSSGAAISVRGGLRATLYTERGGESIQNYHAGDRVEM